ncbi:hypothetical protein HDV05_005028 [Chytridiales sp. JEL 0842]|nr:hypothetical protein HDV05_005028 [Chytridiales sp. JEL 0842]
MPARCPFLARQLATRWKDMKTIAVKHSRVQVPTFRAILLWIYTGQVARDIPKSLAEDWLFICKQWKLTELAMLVQKEMDIQDEKGILHQVLAKRAVVLIRDIKGVQRDLTTLYHAITTCGNSWSRQHIGGNSSSRSLQADDENEQNRAYMELLDASAPDVILDIKSTLFPCHKAFLSRSEYFKALLLGGFSENVEHSNGDKLKPIAMSSIPNPTVFQKILEFLYTDTLLSDVTASLCLELLKTADLLLLDRLKSHTVNHILNIPTSELEKPWLFLRASWEMNLPRLEQHITKFYAERILEFVNDEEFKSLVRDSADSVKNREETDTIIFVDDLRWWLGKLHGFDGDEDVGISIGGSVAVFPGQNVDERRKEYRMKMDMVDNILEELSIYA